MIITCKICTTKYSISKNALGKNGKKVKCSNCGNEWYQKLNIEKKKILTETLEKTEVPINYDKKKDNNTSNFFPSESIFEMFENATAALCVVSSLYTNFSTNSFS